MTKPIQVLIVDDQPLLREGLRLMFDLQADIEVLGEAGNGQEAVDFLSHRKPDVILMDVRMPVMNGVEATRLIRSRYPEVQVIILTTFDDDEFVFEGLKAGALGYLLKDVSSAQLGEAIRLAARGESTLQPSVAAKVLNEFVRISGQNARRMAANTGLPDPLTDRELEILEQLGDGRSNREIAQALSLTEGTVKNYISSLLGKLGVRDRMQAVLRARELGFL